jgi:hypothetical protein
MLENPKYKNAFEKNTPDGVEGAKPVDFEEVKNKRVIHVTNGFYRESCESRSNTTPLKRQNVFAAPEQNYGI